MTNSKFKEVKQGRGREEKGGEGKMKKDKERTGAGKSDSRKGTGR